MRLPHAMSERAAASEPSRKAGTSERPMSRIASRAIASPIGVRTVAIIPAMAWASASMPVCAVASGGTECVSSGSTTASCARSAGAAMPALRPVAGSVIDRAAGDLRARPGRRRHRDERDDRVRIRRLQVAEAHVLLCADARGLRGVDDRAAAERDDRVRARLRQGVRRGVHDVGRRLARRLVEAVDLEVRAPQGGDGAGDGVVAPFEPLVDHEQHPAGAVRRGDAAELERGALAEADPDGQVVREGSWWVGHGDTFGPPCIP